jgi:mRNA interferase RelE/StbE
MYKVLLNKQAAKYYDKVSVDIAKLIDFALLDVEKNPRSNPRIKALQGRHKGLHRYRVKHLRIVYSIDDDLMQVLVVLILPRGEVYKNL